MHKVLAINPGSTSTKVAIFHNSKPGYLKSIQHSAEELAPFKRIVEQYQFRKEAILKELTASGIQLDKIDVIMGRGGILRPISSGVYRINDLMKSDLLENPVMEHASNLGALIADELAKEIPGCNAYIADPVVVDELEDVARYAGHPKFKRRSIFHALNHKAIGRAYAHLVNREYEELNLVIAHMGGGITIGAHRKGKVVDVNQGLDGEGPFSPERAGTLPSGDLVRMAKNEDIPLSDMLKMVTGKGGYMAYLGTNSAYEIELRVMDGDTDAQKVQDAMAYQIGKEIGAYSTVLCGDV
ncbi:MAG: butyrate kinase, partial [Bacteroidales bacterium]|nr:butyrate kinase [Bacteroidales bacterium]